MADKPRLLSLKDDSSLSLLSLHCCYCLIYKIGQMETVIPFSIEKSAFINAVRKEEQTNSHHHGSSSSSTPFAANKQGKKKQNSASSTVHVTPITLNIKESRIHHCLANKEELFNYFKEKNINISLFSYDEDRKNRPPLIKKKSFYEKTFEERKQERLSSLFLTSSSSATSSPFPSPSRQNSTTSSSSSSAADYPSPSPAPPSSSSADHTMVKECEFDIFLNEMKYFDENSVLMNGCAKFDLLIKLKSSNLSSLSIRLSFALHLDSELPLNVNSVKSFFIENKNIYWPENDYYPTQSPLPATWISMLLENYQQKDDNDEAGRTYPVVSFNSENSDQDEVEDTNEKQDEIRYYTDHHQAFSEETKVPTEKKRNTINRSSMIHNKGNHPSSSPHHHHLENDLKRKNSVAVEPTTRRASFLSSLPTKGFILNQEELLTPAQRRENKKSFVKNKFSSTFLLNENQFDPKYIEKNTLALRKMSKILNVKTEELTLLGQQPQPQSPKDLQHLLPHSPFNPSLSSQSDEINPLLSLNRPLSAHPPIVKETTEVTETRRIREFSRLFTTSSSSSSTDALSSQHHSSIVRIAEHHHNAQIKKKKDEAKVLLAIYHNEGFERLLHLLENIFSDEENAFFQHLEKFKNPFSFYPLEKNSLTASHYPSKIAHLEDDNDEENEEVWRFLKSKYIIEKLVETLKNIKIEYFHKDSKTNLNSNSNQDEDSLKVAVHQHLRNNKQQKRSSKSDIEFKRQKQSSQPSTFIEEKKKTINNPVNGIRESLKSFQNRKITDVVVDHVTRIQEEVEDDDDEENDQQEDEEDDDEQGDSNSLDSDMNYISEDILNSMIYTLQYVLVLDFLPVRMKWLTLKSLIIEYSVMFFSSKNSKSSTFNKSRVNIND
jgi:hypothetical protein